MGSEMCIRDRVGTAGGELVQVGVGEPGLEPVAWSAVAHDDRAATCLLYTSDAADERSSVDLGGRRIIKKKNNG